LEKVVLESQVSAVVCEFRVTHDDGTGEGAVGGAEGGKWCSRRSRIAGLNDLNREEFVITWTISLPSGNPG
jgi:hypothetical protein